MESVILTDPICIVGFITALALCVFSLVKKSHISVTVISVIIFVFIVTYALLKGADLYEVGTAAAVFFAVSLIPFSERGGK